MVLNNIFYLKGGDIIRSIDYIVVGSVIEDLRRKAGLSQEVLSGLANISRPHLTMIENGTKHPNLDTMWKLASALDIPPSEIIRMIEQRLSNSSANV